MEALAKLQKETGGPEAGGAKAQKKKNAKAKDNKD